MTLLGVAKETEAPRRFASIILRKRNHVTSSIQTIAISSCSASAIAGGTPGHIRRGEQNSLDIRPRPPTSPTIENEVGSQYRLGSSR